MGKLRIVTLNANTGHGPRGDFWQSVGREKLLENLEAIGTLIRKADADVACLQEVDVRWQRTQSMDQAAFIGSRSGLPYSYSHMHLRSPIPSFLRDISGFPDNVVLNRDLATVILSRYPLFNTRHYDFGQSLTRNRGVNYFARLMNEAKGYTFAELDPGGGSVAVMNVHLLNDIVYQILRYLGRQVRGETFGRAWQAEKLLEHAGEHLQKEASPLIVAGDFNTVPRESQLQFKQSRNGDPDDYRRDITMYLVRESGLLRTIPELFGGGEPESIRPYHTYPAVEPDRTLDYIFVSGGLSFREYRVIGEPVSDHLAVVAEIETAGVGGRPGIPANK